MHVFSSSAVFLQHFTCFLLCLSMQIYDLALVGKDNMKNMYFCRTENACDPFKQAEVVKNGVREIVMQCSI